MEFLDQKEQVINIELTPYGKYLLSVGKFKPDSYAFFDEDIIYDYGFAGVDGELQNEIEDRIQEDTPRFAAQSRFRGAEVAVFSAAPNMVESLMPGVLEDKTNPLTIQNNPTSLNLFQNPLGTSAFNSKKMPSWNIEFLHSRIDSTQRTMTGSNNEIPTAFVPQINCTLKPKIKRFLEPDLDLAGEATQQSQDSEIWDSEVVFPDGTFIEYEEDYIFIQVEEANTEFLKDNFDVEVFEVIDVVGDTPAAKTKETLKPLYFAKDKLKTPEVGDVEYFLDIEIDDEISQGLYCSLVKSRDKVKNIFLDKIFTCPEAKDNGISADVYNTGDNSDPGEACP